MANNLDPSTASREILWNITSPFNMVVMYTLFGISMVIFCYGLYRRFRLYSAGRPANQLLGDWGTRVKAIWSGAFRQKGVNRKKKPKIFHNLIFWGFMVLTFTTTMVAIDHDFGIDIYQGKFYLIVTILSDLFGLGLGIGVLYAAWVRYVDKPDRLHNTAGDWMMLLLLALMVFQGFGLEGLRIAATNDPWAPYSPVGLLTAIILSPLPEAALPPLHFSLWWIHAVTVFVWIALLPYTKFMHIFTASANLFFKKLAPKGALENIGDIEKIMEEAMESGDEEFNLGINNATDLSWKQRLDLDACTSCGRCQELCPAYNSGKVLSPKWLVLDSRDHLLSLASSGKDPQGEVTSNPLDKVDNYLLEKLYMPSSSAQSAKRASNELVQNSRLSVGESWDTPFAGGVMEEDVFWSCTSCRACEEICPVGINHLDMIMGVRRNMAMIEGKIPSEAQGSLRAIETRGNPFGPAESRTDWTEGLEVPILKDGAEVDILYWVGCVSAYDKRKQEIARSMVKILNSSGLSWGILGNRECCTGDPARRLGDENLFQNQVKQNIPNLTGIKFETVVANCPHCFNSLKNEYPQIGEFPPAGTRIIHHSELIKELISDKKIEVSNDINEKVTFHDPCYLGRYNDSYQEPRDVLVQIGAKNLVEMKDNKERGKCCGAGGGHFWMDMKVGERVNVQRTEQALETGASTVATGCPFCLQMMEDGAKLTESEDKLAVKDIAELVASGIQ